MKTKRIFSIVKFKDRRREMRKKSTPQEELLWKSIRNRKIGFKFRRQHSIGGYIVDFYCSELHLVIEIDGSQHYERSMKEYDSVRTKYFEGLGIKVLRFRNKEIESDIEDIILKIKSKNPLLMKERDKGEVNLV